MTGKQLFVRSSMTLALPAILIGVFAAELWRGLRFACRCAWLEVRSNVAAYHELMQREDY